MLHLPLYQPYQHNTLCQYQILRAITSTQLIWPQKSSHDRYILMAYDLSLVCIYAPRDNDGICQHTILWPTLPLQQEHIFVQQGLDSGLPLLQVVLTHQHLATSALRQSQCRYSQCTCRTPSHSQVITATHHFQGFRLP